MKKFYTSLGLTLSILISSGCTSSPVEQSSEQPLNQDAKTSIRSHSEAYIDYNCTPKYVKQASVKTMEVYSGIPLGAQPGDQYFLSDDTDNSTYGNFAVRTLYLTSLYHWHLAHLYSYIYDIYSSEMKALREDHTRFRIMADKSAQEICDIAKRNLDSDLLEASEEAKVRSVYDQLEANWVNFNSWKDASINLMQKISNDIDDSIKEMNTPTCNEYPTADGKYTVVKCTLPPG